MRLPALLFTGLLALSVAPATIGCSKHGSSPTSAFTSGEPVAAKWKDGKYWIATVKGANGDKFDVVYGDGDKGTVPASDMIAIPASPGVKVGDKVLAVWSAARMYTGVVTKVTGDKYTVKWDDGSAPSEVAAGKLVKAP